MNDKTGYHNIPQVFFLIITFLTGVLPIRSVPTFIELITGAMITSGGFVTHAWLAIPMKRHWTSYYKWLQHGTWSWISLGLQMLRLLLFLFPCPTLLLVIDDTIIFRSSKKAPGSGIHHQHGNKPNRPSFVRGQSWVSLAAIVTKGFNSAAIPLLSRMMRYKGNTSKLDAAKVLLRSVLPVLNHTKVCLLMDSWYMRGSLILYAIQKNVHVIGQVRIDTALYDNPVLTGKRGRPRKFGDKYTKERVKTLPSTRAQHYVYGKKQWMQYKCVVAKARFINGLQVKAVWVSFEGEDGKLMQERLLISTDTSLTPLEIIGTYAKRWTVETMFAQIKNNWGWKDAWQQSRQVLHRWTQILSIGYAIPQLIALIGGEEVKAISNIIPWRTNQPITAGKVRLGLKRILTHVAVRSWWNPKFRKFRPPN